MSRIRKRNPVFGTAGLAVAFLLLPLLPSKAFNSRADEEGVRAHFHWHQRHREAAWQRVLRQEQRRRQQQVTGPCSPLETAKVIRIKSYADVAKRLNFGPKQTVMLVLAPPGFITKTGLLFDGNYSCTILRSKKPAQRSYIKLTNALQPVLRIWNTHNVIVMDVNFYLPVKASSRLCSFTEVGKGMLCPAIHIWRSYGVQVAKGEVFGRIDVFRSMQARVDGMSVTGTYRFVNSPGVIRIGESGYGPELVRANIVISNNEAYGVDTPIVMHWGAVGVTVINNFVHDFGFAGIRCGADVHFAGDCMLSNISNNIVYNWRRNSSGDVDSAGIYYCTHWFSPGNVAECNYVAGGDHCYYLDYVTSGVVIRGGACINTYDGIKVNNGKLNVIKHVILKNVEGMPGWCTCFTPTVNNCRKDPGTYWEAMRLKYYDTELFRRLWPWWPSVCKDKSINGVNCNPPGSMAAYLTGNCSGLGTENYLDLVVVNMTKRSLDYKYCEKIPVMPKINTHKMINITTSSLKVLRRMGFRNYKRHDLAIESWSPIYKWRPQFKSCRKGLAGMKVITREEYRKAFNIPKPDYFDFVLAMNLTHIHDRSLF
ncbi:unnamed protein product [Closterium sp. Yama58-4]|nr:unnamed protein product [Closterium sp. Yama58-4]